MSEHGSIDMDSGTEIEFVMVADHAEAVNGKLYLMGGGWDRRGVPDPRQLQSFAIVVSVSIAWPDTNRTFRLHITTLDADGQPLLQPIGTDLTVGRPPNARPGQRTRIMLALNVLTLLPKSGDYVVEARLDERPGRRISFYAEVTPPPAGQG